MACSVMVLADIGKYRPNDFTGQKDRTSIIYDLQRTLSDEIEESYSGAISYIKDDLLDIEEDSEELILGCERPEELKQIVRNWNNEIVHECARQFENLELEVKKRGYQTISEFFRSNNSLDQLVAQISYPASIFELRNALSAVDGVFKYANDKLVYINRGDINCYSPVLNQDTEQYVLEHPEEFMLIELMYD